MKEKLKMSLLFLLCLNSLYAQEYSTNTMEKEFKHKIKNDSSINNSLLSLKTLIRSKDFEASKTFYTQILNLKIMEEYDDGNGARGVIMRFGSSKSNAFFEISEISESHSFYQEQFAEKFKNDKIDIQLRTDSIEYWAKRLKEKWKARGPIDRPWGSKYLYLRDPDGLQIIIYQEKSK